MHLSQLDFELPEELIARHPSQRRGDSRLLVQPVRQKPIDANFVDLADYLRDGDLLVLNDTRVVPARLELRKETGGQVEGLWIEATAEDQTCARMLLSGGRLRPGVVLHATSGEALLELQSKLGRGVWLVRSCGMAWAEIMRRFGTPPLPPYIRRLRKEGGEDEIQQQDFDRYQTLWATAAGSIAAPTASLHFDQAMLDRLNTCGVQQCSLTLHVGLGTFLPIEAENLSDHRMHSEDYEVPAETAALLNRAKQEGRRVVAVGTTVTRVLESLPDVAQAQAASTDLFLAPGAPFRWVDALLTNFHTPRSSLLALVAGLNQALGGDGIAEVKRAYQHAVEARYRFYSYGDASLWTR